MSDAGQMLKYGCGVKGPEVNQSNLWDIRFDEACCCLLFATSAALL